jgi:hypothetical protein
MQHNDPKSLSGTYWSRLRRPEDRTKAMDNETHQGKMQKWWFDVVHLDKRLWKIEWLIPLLANIKAYVEIEWRLPTIFGALLGKSKIVKDKLEVTVVLQQLM